MKNKRIHPGHTTTPTGLWKTIGQSINRLQTGQLQDIREQHKLRLQALLSKATTLSEQAEGTPLQDRTSELAYEIEVALETFVNKYPYVSTNGELTT